MNNTVLIKNIYYMLAYVFDSIDDSNLSSLSSESFDHIDDMLSGLLIMLMNKQIKQGLYRDYISNQEELKMIRGRINFAETIRTNSLMKKSVVCGFDEYSENNISNQIIKATLLKMLSCEKLNENKKKDIKRILDYLIVVEDVDLQTVKIKGTKASNQYKNYRFMLYICQLYKDKEIFSEENQAPVKELLGVKSYHELYENFVLSYFRKEYPQYRPSGTNMRWDTNQDGSLLPMMKTDITLFKEDEVLIIDTKYYTDMYGQNNNVERIRSSHMYQIFAYVFNYSAQNKIKTSGMLLYAETKHEARLDVHENVSGYDLYFKSLNLNTDFENIKAQLDEIACL